MNKSKKKSKNGNSAANKSSNSEPSALTTYEYEGRNFDRMLHACIGRYAGWLSPTAFILAYTDWLSCLSIAPARQRDLSTDAMKKLAIFFLYASECCSNKSCEQCIPIRQSDHRFQNELWNHVPYNLYSQFFLLSEQWWNDATTYISGVSRHHQNLINFISRQILDIYSPSNIPWMNPEIIEASISQCGMNYIKGFNNFVEDVIRNVSGKPPAGSEEFKVGINLAVTPGKVIYRNNLIELIQYSPTTTHVYAEPILIVPAWIMKYYILDLSPDNSMVKFLVDKGHTVFMISWKNPTTEDRDLSLTDYVNLGVMDAIDVISQIIPKMKIQTVGYCIGGTLLMIAAARMAKKSDNRINSITLFAAEIDFKDAGELLLFIDENQINYLEDIMWEKGYLDGSQMAGAFSMLRSIDLIWSRVVRDYLLGQRQQINDLMAWDYDTTRMPYKMHSEYLRKLFLNNDLVQGRFKISHRSIHLSDISVPLFVVSTLKDHVAPWKSVYKVHFFIDTNITFVLTNAGHNTGIVDEPGQPGRSYQMLTHEKGDKHLSSETWQERAPHFEGSWWPAWETWLVDHSGNKVKPPELGNEKKDILILCDAPGTYVLQK